MLEPQPLRLVDRLRGIYHLPVDDGAGPLDGSMIFTREFKPMMSIQPKAADMIERLESGEKICWSEVNSLCLELQQPADPLDIGKPYILPINQEAASTIYHLRLDMEPK